MFVVRGSRAVLRDITNEDIEKLISWESREIASGDYRLWDAPWEYEGKNSEQLKEELEAWRLKLQSRAAKASELSDSAPRSWLIIADRENECFGWCASYFINENGEYSPEDTGLTAVGLDILDPAARGKGLGFAALKLFIDYLTVSGTDRIFTQTWSGNRAMILLARKLGFKEIIRKKDIRSVRGETYDGLTFELDREAFSMLIEPEEELPIRTLTSLGIPFTRISHPAAYTMELCRGIGGELGARHCKNLFLANRSETLFYLYMTGADKPFRTSEVSRLLGVSRMSFGSAQKLSEVMGLRPGCVSVMGFLNECARLAYRDGRLRLALDSELLDKEYICVHPNTDTATLVLKTSDLVRLLSLLGIRFAVV